VIAVSGSSPLRTKVGERSGGHGRCMYALALVPIMSGMTGTSWTRGDTARTSLADSASDASPAMGASAGYSSRSHGGGMSPRLLGGSPGAQSMSTSGPPPPASPGNHRLVLGHRSITEHRILQSRAAGAGADCSSAETASAIGRSPSPSSSGRREAAPSESKGTTPSLTAGSSSSSEVSKRASRVPRKPRPPKAAKGRRLRGGRGRRLVCEDGRLVYDSRGSVFGSGGGGVRCGIRYHRRTR
jgi:hypothetical protein